MDYLNENHEIGSLADYLGIPYNYNTTLNQTDLKVSALPFAAYQAIYNEYYRDQNLITAINYKVIDGTNDFNSELIALRRRAWEHDYFTACLPFAQKGPAVDIPLGKVTLDDTTEGTFKAGFKLTDYYHPTNTGQDPSNGNMQLQNGVIPGGIPEDSSGRPVVYDPNGTLQVEPTTINDLRRAFKLQEWLEKAARGGSRYIEWIKVMFGVTSSDARLQRPEYITGTKSPVVISEVLNTTGIDGELPQGNMAGHAVSVTHGGGNSYYCEEHGWIMGIMSVMPKPAYMQGIERGFTRLDNPTEYFFSSFANIGEQQVLNKEIYAYDQGQEGAFGYIPRYAEYRYQSNRVAGQFRTTFENWHAARKFANLPGLNQNFVECDPTKRFFAVEDPEVETLYCQVLNKVTSIRPIPKYGTPTF